MVNFHAVIGIQYYPLLFTIFLCSIKLWFNFLCMSGIADLLKNRVKHIEAPKKQMFDV